MTRTALPKPFKTCFLISDLPWRPQRFDDAALRYAAVTALGQQLIQLSTQCRKIANLPVDLRQVLPGDRVDCLARLVPVFSPTKQDANLLQ